MLHGAARQVFRGRRGGGKAAATRESHCHGGVRDAGNFRKAG